MRVARLLGFLILAAVGLGCGGEDKPTTPAITVTVSPSTADLVIGHAQQFTAVATGTASTTFSWSVDGGAENGTISSTGLYTAPATIPTPATVTVRAALVVDPSKTGTAEVRITPPPVAVSVHPATTTVGLGLTQHFTATVTETENTAVTWSVDEDATHGTIDATGAYLAPATAPDPPTATVRATSVADPSRSGTAVVTLAGAVPEGFAHVPAGSFTMGDGSSDSYCGSTEYPVTLTEDFYLGQTEVTNQQCLEMVQWAYDQGYVTATETSVTDALGSTWELLDLDDVGSEIAFSNGVFSLRDAGHGINPNHPVKAVTWYGAAAYCDWLSLRESFSPAYSHTSWTCNGGDPYRAQGYRLPTDAEWEYAAQFDDERIYPWGNEAPNTGLANIRRDPQTGWTEPVGSYPAEKTIGGREVHDMAGNAYEWCNDWHRCHAAPSPVDPPGPSSGTYRILRGGAWTSDDAILRCAYRFLYASPPNPPVLYRHGFRVVRTVDP